MKLEIPPQRSAGLVEELTSKHQRCGLAGASQEDESALRDTRREQLTIKGHQKKVTIGESVTCHFPVNNGIVERNEILLELGRWLRR